MLVSIYCSGVGKAHLKLAFVSSLCVAVIEAFPFASLSAVSSALTGVGPSLQ